MTKDQLYDRVLRERIAIAQQATGYSFFGLLDALDKEGAVSMARRFISPKHAQEFQDGLRELKKAGLLHLSVEQSIIDFSSKGYIFSCEEAQAAGDRLRLIVLLLV